MRKKRDTWSSKLGFILAVAGSAVGLANIWRFPYLVGENGGAIFIAIYLLFIILIGYPVFLSEILIGRTTSTSPSGAYKKLGGSQLWQWGGKLTIITGFIVSAFYSAVAGWILGYLVEALEGNLSSFQIPSDVSTFFSQLIGSSYWTLSFHFLFILFCSGILYFGVRGGIEKGTKIMMPLLLVTLLGLVIKGLFLPEAKTALKFLFSPDLSEIRPSVLLTALGQAFFTLSLGQGTMVTYGSYLNKKENIISTSIPVVIMDVGVSLLAAMAVFTIVFSVGMEPDAGFDLLFKTLPWVFSQMPGGYIIAVIFFFLVVLAAATSEISAMEPTIAYLRDELKFSRHLSVVICAVGAFILGIPSALAFSLFKNDSLFGMDFLSFFNFLCSNILIPIGGLLAVLLVGWRWGIANAVDEINIGSNDIITRRPWLKAYLTICLKYIAPASILIVFFHALGLLG